MARNVFDIEEVWNPNVAMVTKLFSSYCGASLAESCCQESNISDTNWPRYRLADNFAYFKNLKISGMKKYI